jgi:UDP-glucose 4-epimerase
MKILITGASGFLGSYLIKALEPDFEVMYLMRDGSMVSSDEITIISRMNLAGWIPDVIIMAHAAVSSGITHVSNTELFEGNVTYTQKIIQRFPDAHIIYTSTVSVYKIQEGFYNELSTVSPLTAYAISKWWGERVVQGHSPHTIVRFPSLYGIGMKENTIIPNYVSGALTEGRIKVWGDGKRLQNYLHISDACGFLKACLTKLDLVKNVTLLAVSNQSYSNRELALIIAEDCNAGIDFVNEDSSPGFQYDNQYSKNLISFEPLQDFKKGILEYLAWKRKQ